MQLNNIEVAHFVLNKIKSIREKKIEIFFRYFLKVNKNSSLIIPFNLYELLLFKIIYYYATNFLCYQLFKNYYFY